MADDPKDDRQTGWIKALAEALVHELKKAGAIGSRLPDPPPAADRPGYGAGAESPGYHAANGHRWAPCPGRGRPVFPGCVMGLVRILADQRGGADSSRSRNGRGPAVRGDARRFLAPSGGRDGGRVSTGGQCQPWRWRRTSIPIIIHPPAGAGVGSAVGAMGSLLPTVRRKASTDRNREAAGGSRILARGGQEPDLLGGADVAAIRRLHGAQTRQGLLSPCRPAARGERTGKALATSRLP